MANIMILNGSPRASRSNSKEYAQLFRKETSGKTDYFEIIREKPERLCQEMERFSDVLLVFPLYADSIPVTLLQFLKVLERFPIVQRPTVSVVVNCGFLEPWQNDTAVSMIRLYCRQTGFPFGSVLKIGAGEAILSTPFRFLVSRSLRKLAQSMEEGKHRSLQVTMPLPKRLFLRASTAYWKELGKRNGLSAEQMRTLRIEDRE